MRAEKELKEEEKELKEEEKEREKELGGKREENVYSNECHDALCFTGLDRVRTF